MISENKSKIRNYLPAIGIIISITFSVRGSNNMFLTNVPLLAKDYFGFSKFELGILISISSFAAFIMSAFINSRIPSSKRKILFRVSIFIYAIVFPFFAFSDGLSIWFITVVEAFVLGAVMPNIITSAGMFQDRAVRERVLALYTVALSLSLAVEPLLEGYIITISGEKLSFLYFSAFPFVAFILSFFIKFPEENEKGRKNVEYSRVLKDRGFIVSTLNNLMYAIPFAFLTTYGGLYGEQVASLNSAEVNYVFSVFFASSFLSRLFYAAKAPENIFNYMLISGILTAFGLVLIAMSVNAIELIFSFLLLGIPHGFTYPVSITKISRSFEVSTRNSANSFFYSIMMIVGSITPFLLGFEASDLGYRLSFLTMVQFSIAVFILIILFERFPMGFKKPLRENEN
ncbi:MFS transporter [Caldiplasma sukawensis]